MVTARLKRGAGREPFAWWLVMPFVPIVAYSILRSLCAYGDARAMHAMALARIEMCRQATARLANEVSALRSDPSYIERVAREQFGYTRPGETRIILSPRGTHGARTRANHLQTYARVLRERLTRAAPLLVIGLLVFATALALDTLVRHWETTESTQPMPGFMPAALREEERLS